MTISRYQKFFGVGPLNLCIGIVLFGLLVFLDRQSGHVEITSHVRLIQAAGLILLGLWVCWHTWSIISVRQWWRHDRLCTSGPFRLVRHPLYSGTILLGATGAALLCNSWVVLVTPVLMYPILSLLVRKEEAMMLAIFGDEYRRYAARTGCLFPKP
jgi:protein-S-isoprenylcysteine O-methyltransferase Ste14